MVLGRAGLHGVPWDVCLRTATLPVPVNAEAVSLPQQVFMGAPSSPSAGYRKMFNSLPGRVCPTAAEDKAARAAVDRVVSVLQQQLPQGSRVRGEQAYCPRS